MSKNSNKTSKNKTSYKGSRKAFSEGQTSTTNANLEPLGEHRTLENLRQSD